MLRLDLSCRSDPAVPLRTWLCALALAPLIAGGAGAGTVQGPVIMAPPGQSALPADEALALVEPMSPAPGGRAGPAAASAGAPPVVIELFTAQGCSSCPPADAMLAALARRDDVLALSWHVDYWDYLGWSDAYARPEFTRRQHGYAAVSGERAVYTPQIIVDGQDTPVRADRASLGAMIADHAARPPAVAIAAQPSGEGFELALTPGAPVPGGVDILSVRYAPLRQVAIMAGENRGTSVDYVNVVLSVSVAAHWDARSPLTLTLVPQPADDGGEGKDARNAILAQQRLPGGLPGPILTALRLD